MLANFLKESLLTTKPVADQIACSDFGVTDQSLPAGFAAGLIAELSGQDWNDYLATCFVPSTELSNQLACASDYYSKNDFVSGYTVIMRDAEANWKTALAGCDKSKAAWDEIWAKNDELWSQSDVQTRLDTAAANSSNKLLIYIASTYYSRGQPWKSGLAQGRVEHSMVGDLDSCQAPALPETYDSTATAQFAAGFLYASSQHTMDERDYILECFEGSDTLTAWLYDLMADISSGDTSSATAKMTCSLPAFYDAMEACDKTNPAFRTAETFYADFNAQDDAESVRAANYEKNGLTIDRDLGYMATTWDQGVFFNTGFFAGEALGLYEGYPDYSA